MPAQAADTLETMKAIALTRYLPITDPDSLVDIELPDPIPGPFDILVRVESVSVNPVDTKVRRPKAKVENSPRILGWDAAGTVEAVGHAVTRFNPGEKVYYAGDITRPGCNAQLQVVDERIAGKMPLRSSFSEAAALPLTAITAWEALFEQLQISRTGKDQGKTLLIIGGAGGVGSIAIQLARLAGITVIATASRPESQQWVKELGSMHVINHHQELLPQIRKCGFEMVDMIANFSDTDRYWNNMAELIRPRGRIVSIVENAQPLDLNTLKSKSAVFAWEFMFTRPMYQTPDMIRQGELLDELARLVDSGEIRSTLTKTLSPICAETLRQAHAQLESGSTIGKLVISGW